MTQKGTALKWVSFFTCILMILVNGFDVSITILEGKNIAEVSNEYLSFITPAVYMFSKGGKE
jgi:hypothetical protein